MNRITVICCSVLLVLAMAGCHGLNNGGTGTTPGPSTNTELSSLEIQGGTLNKAFSPSISLYETTVDIAQTSLTVKAVASDPAATVSYDPTPTVALFSNATSVRVIVKAPSGAFRVYKVIAFKSDYVSPNLGKMINIPAGFFYRTSAKTSTATVTKSYRICQHEVTRSQWVGIMGAGNDPTKPAYSSGSMEDPVMEASWYQIIAYCNKLSLAEGLTQVYSVGTIDFSTLTYADIPTTTDAAWEGTTANWTANGYRLPTMVEWQWAAMGTDSNGAGKAFAGSDGSNLLKDYAVFGYYYTDFGRTTLYRTDPVCGKYANEIGLYDMSGNLAEWLWDLSGTVPSGNLVDYTGPTALVAFRKDAGGGFPTGVESVKVLAYDTWETCGGSPVVGFRVVRFN